MIRTAAGVSGENYSHELVMQTGMLWRFARWIVLFNVLMLGATAIVYDLLADTDNLHSVVSKPITILVLSQFNLTAENTLATWYSSMLLLTTALLALLCFLFQRNIPGTETRLNKGWLVISLFFTLLSLDELGSVHENAGSFASMDMMGTKTWESVLFLPLVVVMIFMLLFAWKEVKWNTPSFWLMAIGTLMFLSVPLQELIETRMWNSHDETWTRPVLPGLLEEGTELFATWTYFLSMTIYLAGKNVAYRTASLQVPCNARRVKVFTLVGVGAFLLAYFFIWIIEPSLQSDEGIAINWFPAASAIALFLVVLGFRTERRWPVLIYCVLISGYYGTDYYSLVDWKAIEPLTWVIKGIMVTGLVVFVFLITLPFREGIWRLLYIGAGLTIASGFLFSHPIVTFFSTSGILLIFWHQVQLALHERDHGYGESQKH